MKNQTLLFALFVVMFSFSSLSYAQVNGNINYDKGNINYNSPAAGNINYSDGNAYNSYYNTYSNQQYTKGSRTPASNAVINYATEVPFEINGLMNIVASDYVAMFNIIQVGETPDNTDLLMNKRISQFKLALVSSGIDSSNITVDMISFVPKFDYQEENKIFSKTFNEVPAGFEMQKTVSVHYNNSNILDKIVSSAAGAEIYDLVKVDYFIPNLQKAIDSIRTNCLKALNTKISSYQTIGFKLDTMKRVMAENFTTVYPETRYFSYTAVCKPSMNAARKKNSTDKINEISTSASQFYQQINYDQYDFVINPVVTQPVVQISYTIAVKYYMNQPKENTNIYYYITPTGETKQLFLK